MNDRPRIVILGAGPAGLGAAYQLERSGCKDWTLYERETTVGGLSKSIRDEHGFTWDLGGHVVFSHYGLYTRLLRTLLEPKDWIEHQRESWIRVLKTWVPYPFQNNIHRLPATERIKCLEGLVRATQSPGGAAAKDFEQFILRTFGCGIAELFMLPYNYKVWAYPPSRLGVNWLGERVAVPDLARVVQNVVRGEDDVSWGPNNQFSFPRHGGTGAIWSALAQTLPESNVRLGREVVGIDVDASTVRFADGGEDRYEALISTLPIDRLARMSGRQDWIEATSGLLRSSTYVIGVGLEGKAPDDLATKCWMYFPEDNSPFYRATHFSLYSPNNVDDIGQHWSLMCEVSESPEKLVDPNRVVEETIAGLLASGLIDSPRRVHHIWLRHVDYSYPIPTPDRDAILNRILPELADHRILSRGRFGAWRYEVGNMDHSFMQGYEAAAHLLYGSPELTLWEPSLVNTPHPVLGWNRWR
jgi:protoporphyrinogen oxidase